MPATLPVSPYPTLTTVENVTYPYYIIQFDKSGKTEKVGLTRKRRFVQSLILSQKKAAKQWGPRR